MRDTESFRGWVFDSPFCRDLSRRAAMLSSGLLAGFLVLSVAAAGPAPVNTRLFATDAAAGGIIEIDPDNGAVLNTFTTPAPQGVSDALAFDGTHLWYLSGSRAPNTLYRLDPDDGGISARYTLPDSAFRNGLAVQNGRVYILDFSVLSQQITVFDPALPGVTGSLDIDQANPSAPLIGGGLAAIGAPNALLVTTAQSGEILEIDPASGRISGRFEHGQGSGALGLAVVSGEIYLARNVGASVAVFDRAGVLQRRFEVDGSIGMQSLGGDEGAADDPIFSDHFESRDAVAGSAN